MRRPNTVLDKESSAFLVDLMLQHRLIQRQLDIENLLGSDLAGAPDAVRTFEGERAGPAYVVQGARQIERLRMFAPLDSDLEGFIVRQISLSQERVTLPGQ